MFNVAILAPILHTLFNDTASDLARAAGLIKRRGKLTPHDLLRALVFGFLKRRDATLEDLAQPLRVSRQALDQRLDQPTTADFLKRALLHAANEALRKSLAAGSKTHALLAGFQGVYLDDSTQAKLPDDAACDFPGCGSGDGVRGKAGMKVMARWEIQNGHVHHLGIHAAKVSDHDAMALAPLLPAGCLHLADLGFCDFERLSAETLRGAFWITRLPANTNVRLSGQDGFEELARALAAWRREGTKEVDTPACVGKEEALAGRLLAFACPADVVARRLAALQKDAKRRGRAVTARQREMCRWTVLLTNVAGDKLNAEGVWRVYRLRWQVELLFKRFKSEGGLDETSSGKAGRVECEWYAKLLGQVVRNWLQLLHGGPLRDVNGAQVGRVVADCLVPLIMGLGDIEAIARVLAELIVELAAIRKRTRRKKHKTVSQAIEDQDFNA